MPAYAGGNSAARPRRIIGGMTGNADGGASGGATAYIGLGIAAAALGAATAVGVFLFNKAFGLVHQAVFDGVGEAIAPLGAWTLIPLVAAGGIVVAVIVRFMRPEPLGALPHVIDGVLEHDGRLNDQNAAVAIAGGAVGIGFGMPLGADTPSAMIGGHLGSLMATWLGWSSTFVRALVVAGVAAGISSTFLAQLAAVVFAFEVVLGGFGGIVFVVPDPDRGRRRRPRDLRARRDAGDLPGPADGGPLGRDPAPLSRRRGRGGPRRDRLRPPPAAMRSRCGRGSRCRRWVGWSSPARSSGSWRSGCPQIMGTGTATMKDLFGGATIPLATLLALADRRDWCSPHRASARGSSAA